MKVCLLAALLAFAPSPSPSAPKHAPPGKLPCKCAAGHLFTWIGAARINFYCSVDKGPIACEINPSLK